MLRPRIRLPGENIPPVEYAPEYSPVHDDFIEPDSDSLDWRKIIEGAALSGPQKNLAQTGEVLELDSNHVKIRLASTAFATEINRERLSEQLTRYFGHRFHVVFETGKIQGVTVGDVVSREREIKRKALLEEFKNDDFVKRVVAVFNGTIDEASVKANEG